MWEKSFKNADLIWSLIKESKEIKGSSYKKIIKGVFIVSCIANFCLYNFASIYNIKEVLVVTVISIFFGIFLSFFFLFICPECTDYKTRSQMKKKGWLGMIHNREVYDSSKLKIFLKKLNSINEEEKIMIKMFLEDFSISDVESLDDLKSKLIFSFFNKKEKKETSVFFDYVGQYKAEFSKTILSKATYSFLLNRLYNMNSKEFMKEKGQIIKLAKENILVQKEQEEIAELMKQHVRQLTKKEELNKTFEEIDMLDDLIINKIKKNNFVLKTI